MERRRRRPRRPDRTSTTTFRLGRTSYRGAIARLDAYETQDLVAEIFRAIGYSTQVTSPGPDRGTDIVASRDPLAVEPPIIRVQVKARPNGRSSASEIRELAGVLDPGDRGSSYQRAASAARPRRTPAPGA
jgi:predicted Mrr-cat superfamily restriction endonuclease